MKKSTTIAAALMLSLLTACGGKEAAEHYTDAQSFIQQQKYSSAVIELKSAIQQAPENKEYRLALGLLYLKIGDSVAAEKELTRAFSLGVETQIVAIPLIRSAYQAGNHSYVLELFTEDNSITAEQALYIKTYKALSELELGDADSAISLFTELSTQQDFADIAALSQAHLLIANRNNIEAISTADSITKESLIYQEALFLKGRSQLAEEDSLASIDSFTEYLQIVPNNILARLMLTQSLVKTEQYDLADNQLKLLLKAYPNQPLANYLKAVLEYDKENFTLAKEHAEKAINNGLRSDSARIIAALSSLKLNLESQAIYHLDSIQANLAKYPPLQSLYASLQLKAGQTDEAKDILLNQSADNLDLKLLANTSFQLIKQGSNTAAEQLIDKYEQSAKGDVTSLTTLGMLKLGLGGQQMQGVRDLEQALLLDPSQNQARIVLAISYLKQHEYAKASALADEWLDDPELAIVGYNLKAYSALLQDDTTNAKVFLTKAEQSKADNPFTMLLQAIVAYSEKDHDKANALLLKTMQLHPTYVPALQQYYTFAKTEGKAKEALVQGQSILDNAPESNNLRLTVAKMYHQEQNYQKVIDLLEHKSINRDYAPSGYWATLIDAHAKLNHSQDVIKLSDQWYKLTPDNLHAAFFYANGLALNKNFNEAVSVLDKQLRKFPNNLMLLKSKIIFLAENKDYKTALKTFDAIDKEAANQADILFIKARVTFLDGQIPPSLELFNQSYLLAPSDETAMYIAEIYSKQYSYKRAIQFLEQHFATHPVKGNLKVFYANLLLQSDQDKAFKLYNEILEESPNNYIVLNNYAWVLAEDNQLDKAKVYIERALKQAPKHPDVLDTYGKVLLLQNNLAAAITAFEQSLQVRSNNAEVSLNYAEALIKSGKPQQAASVLNKLAINDVALLKRKSDLEKLLP
ncbi:XrtA/PEP-CTERM system TPR-repeat protein PrsT [Rheinheimera sp. MMS21-TC3]|uniref:XrtA/PEP-CTERM system TPR-repeat protein PrsT n=1 Tax=Rheinheimera sp. MMS21-TC3 TaxID=3072790 RepID=UPI0028C37E8C|nr:XrtA/PEP-CTERM system TPR-repeat protein PrsT [Rheinheimera sp. MMS21-TC3]WNO60671.1 PEP-CTERM system TPR-repeat protein PrsT [Rheinheimera sp. MMS21-TC3]